MRAAGRAFEEPPGFCDSSFAQTSTRMVPKRCRILTRGVWPIAPTIPSMEAVSWAVPHGDRKRKFPSPILCFGLAFLSMVRPNESRKLGLDLAAERGSRWLIPAMSVEVMADLQRVGVCFRLQDIYGQEGLR